jgi:hypothetical protein
MTGSSKAAKRVSIWRSSCLTRPQLAKLIADIPARSYRNGNGIAHDLITDIPFAIGPENYVHPRPLTDVSEDPDEYWTQHRGIFAWHAMPLYLRAVEKIEGLPLTPMLTKSLDVRIGLA